MAGFAGADLGGLSFGADMGAGSGGGAMPEPVAEWLRTIHGLGGGLVRHFPDLDGSALECCAEAVRSLVVAGGKGPYQLDPVEKALDEAS